MEHLDPASAVNFRDVGEFVGLIAGHDLLPRRRLLRGGAIQSLPSFRVIGEPRTVLCLKNGPNADREGVAMLHFPRPNTAECYETARPEVRSWLRAILRSLTAPPVRLPLYIHCHSGRDRTGVVVAFLLRLIDLPDEVIFEEYMLSGGADAMKIRRALDGLKDVERRYPAHESEAVRRMLTSRPSE